MQNHRKSLVESSGLNSKYFLAFAGARNASAILPGPNICESWGYRCKHDPKAIQA